MADDTQVLRAISWRDAFPFTNLFRGFRIAVHPSKLVLALTALILIYGGGRFLDWVWPNSTKPTIVEVAFLEGNQSLEDFRAIRMDVPKDMPKANIFDVFFGYEIQEAQATLNSFLPFTTDQALPWYAGFDHAWRFVARGPGWLWGMHWVFALIFTAWFLLIWSIFGGAISRIAAVHFARDEKISVRQALRFSSHKILSFIFAPLIPLLITLGIGVVLAICGWILFHIPYAGPIIAGVFWILALLAGLVMTLVVLGLLGGFNLMYPTIAVEGSDSFDAISRSFSYIFARPWRMLFYTIVSLIYGAICYLFVRFFIYLILILTWFFVGWWLTSKNVHQFYPWMFPRPDLGHLVYNPYYHGMKWSEDVAATLIALWNYLLISLLGAFAISFYFSSSTITYFLMRREVDATEIDDVYVEESEDELTETAPIMPASNITPTPVSDGPAVVVAETIVVTESPAPISPAPEALSTPSEPATPPTEGMPPTDSSAPTEPLPPTEPPSAT